MVEDNKEHTSILSRTTGMVSNRTRFKIFQAVAAVHVVVVAGPFIYQTIFRMINPPPKRIINVRMIEQLPEKPSDINSSSMGGAPPPPQPQIEPGPTAPDQPKLKPITIKPPPIRPVKVTPKEPVIKPPPVITPQPPVVKPKNQPKPNPKPAPKPKPQPKPAPKPQPQQDNKNFKPISDKDWQNMNKPPTTSTSASTSTTPTTSGSPKGSDSRSNKPIGPPGDNNPGDKFALDYSQFVGNYLKQHWEPPSRLQLGGREPEVTVTLYLAPSGQITSWKIVKSSGVTIMDNSVERLLRYVRKIPQPPPKGLNEITLIMVITD